MSHASADNNAKFQNNGLGLRRRLPGIIAESVSEVSGTSVRRYLSDISQLAFAINNIAYATDEGDRARRIRFWGYGSGELARAQMLLVKKCRNILDVNVRRVLEARSADISADKKAKDYRELNSIAIKGLNKKSPHHPKTKGGAK